MPSKLNELIINTLSTPILVLDKHASIVRCNAAAARLFDYSEQALLRLTLPQLLAEPGSELRPEQEAINAMLQQWEQVDTLRENEILVKRSHGMTFPLAIRSQALSYGRKRYYILEMRNLSNDHRTRQAILTAQSQADIASAAKTQFLALISHEIRNPINTVLGSLRLMLSSQLDDNQQSLLETAHTAGESLRGTINDLLDYASLEAGDIEPKIADFDVIALVESVAELLAPQAFAKELTIATLIRPEVARSVRGDSGRIRQLLLQLTDNAVKYTQLGGICINIRLISRATLQPESLLRFEINDTGPGIALADQDRVFQAFSQNAPAYSRQQGGLGLGLATCKRLVELLDGQIGLDSTPGIGTTFWFELPYQAAQQIISEPPIAFEKLAGRRILLVDANPISSTALQELLQSWRLQVVLAQSADEAFQVLQTNSKRFDIILIDQYFCDQSGTNLAHSIKQTPGLENTRLVLLVTMGAYSTLQNMRAIGFQAFLAKPIRQASLYRWLSVAVGLDNRDEKENHLLENLAGHSETASHHYQILLVEDSQMNQAVAIAMLRRTAYRVDAVNNGMEALHALRSLPYDLVLMDLSMPEMDGFETTARIRKLPPPVGQIPIIAVSANVVPEDRERLHSLGFNDYVTKPIDRQRLLSAIKHWLQLNNHLAMNTDNRLPILDIPTLDKLADETNPTIMRRIMTLFIQETRRRITQIKLAQSTEDWELLIREAHTLKGSAGTFGTLRLQDRAKALELACRDQQAQHCQELVASMSELAETSLLAITEYLATSVPPS